MTITHYSDLILESLKNNIPVQLTTYNGYLGIIINNITFGPFPWEIFEEPIEPEAQHKVSQLEQIIRHKRIDNIIKKSESS